MIQLGRRQHPHLLQYPHHHHLEHDNSDSDSLTYSQSQSHPPYLNHPSAADIYAQLAIKNYFDSTSAHAPAVADHPVNPYMSDALNCTNPSIRLQQSTPVNVSSAAPAQQSMLVASRPSPHRWTGYDAAFDAGSIRTPPESRRHRRAPSSSSLSASSVYDHPSAYNQNMRAELSPPTSAGYAVESSHDDESKGFQKHLPTPTQTPTQDTFLAPAYQTFNPQLNPETTMAHLAMKQALMDQHSVADDDTPGFSHSGRHSVSSYGQSPATPRTVYDDCGDERFKFASNGMIPSPSSSPEWTNEYLRVDDADVLRQTVPKFERTMSEIYGDELYNPLSSVPPPAPSAKNPALLSPYRSVINDRINAANEARSQSPTSTASRAVSPFRNGSPLAPAGRMFGSPRARLGSASSAREQQDEAEALAMKGQQETAEELKTISPKDALLDYNETAEDAKMPLFPSGTGYDTTFDHQRHQYQDTAQVGFNGSSDQTFGGMTQQQQQTWENQLQAATADLSNSNSIPTHTDMDFSASTSLPAAVNGTPFSTHQYTSTANIPSRRPEVVPEFPPLLTSMESSASEAPDSSQETAPELTKPAGSLADSGTYTCTYHGCTQRFETPQKLQRHKRDDHRPNVVTSSVVGAGLGSGMTSAALMARNSQAGPHRCDRVNPSTGKPCSTIFSRPYDLTRHEDTIHNARKQKVRCALCVEEKTFSRNDALTRHMRVVHPEIDFPGKHRRRGGHD